MRIVIVLIFLLYSFHLTSQTIDTTLNMGDYSLHFTIYPGEGTPILFEAGNGEGADVWAPLLPSIHELTQTTLITYDRAGLGKSSIDTTSITFQGEIKDLDKALSMLCFENDYFLVAHSFGSMYASEFSNLEHRKIIGAVFIDVSTPCNLSQEYTSRIRNTISQEDWTMIKKYKPGLYYVLQRFPEIARYMSTRYLATEIPLTVIVADNYSPFSQIGETQNDMILWQSCLRELGHIDNHNYIVAKGTDHKVWIKDPQIVIQEISKLYDQLAH